MSSVLLTIDVQEDFSKPGAPSEIPGTWKCIPAMKKVLEAFRELELPVVHVVRFYSPDGENADLCSREQIKAGRRIVTPGTNGAELVSPLKPDRDMRLDAPALLSGKFQPFGHREWAMYKPRWDAFFGTPLEARLRKLRVERVVIVGCNFPNCPRATAYGASMRDFHVMLIADAVSGTYKRGLAELNRIGVETLNSREFLRWLGIQPAGANSDARPTVMLK